MKSLNIQDSLGSYDPHMTRKKVFDDLGGLGGLFLGNGVGPRSTEALFLLRPGNASDGMLSERGKAYNSGHPKILRPIAY